MSMLFVYVATFVQVVAESFPVSSSGHLALLDKLWRKIISNMPEYALDFPWNDVRVWERYVELLHMVPLIVIAWYFYPRWRIFLWHPLRTWRLWLRIISYAVLANSVTGILYVARSQLLFFSMPLRLGFSVTTLLLLSLLFVPHKNAKLTTLRALALGLIQGLALLPGVSRFAATFCGSRWLGFSSRSSFEVSFMLQWPLLLLAVLRSLLFFSVECQESLFTVQLVSVFFVSAIFAAVGFYSAARLARNERLWLFAFYVAAVALIAGVCGC